MDQGTLIPAVLIGCFAVFAIFATLGGLYVQSRVRAARAAKWLAGVYGTWTGLEDSGAWERERAISSLRSWYAVESQADLDALLEDLVRGRQTGNPAWDAGRGADTVRIGFAAGYLSPSDVKDWAFRIAEVLQTRYASWQQYATAFEAGMHAWQDRAGVQDAEARGRVQRNVPVLVAQVWPAVEFKTPFE